MNRLAAASVLALASLALATPAFADHSKDPTCHPVEGKGETGSGWNIISPDKASSHIDEGTGAGKHTRKDGRTDVYAVNGLCPGQPVPSPTSIPTTVTPSPTTGGTPSTTPSSSPTSATTRPTSTTTSTTRPTTTSPSPSPTSSTPAMGTTTTTSPSPAEPTTRRAHAPTGSPNSSPSVTSTTSPSPASPRRSVPSTTDAPPVELAHTGARLTLAIAVGLLLLAAGSAFIRTARRGARREH